MNSVIRKTTSLRLPDYLMAGLREEARKQNRSMNSFMENILYEALYHTPNTETCKAIEESKKGIYAGTIDTTSMETFKASLGL